MIILSTIHKSIKGRVAPTYLVKCPSCLDQYATTGWILEVKRRSVCHRCAMAAWRRSRASAAASSSDTTSPNG